MIKMFVAAAAASFFVGGCATPYEPIPVGIDYGAAPSDYERRITEYMNSRLKDPESARYRFDPPRPAYIRPGYFSGQRIAYAGYRVGFELNAKNSFGGYVGSKPYFALFVGDQLYSVGEGSSHPRVQLAQ